MISYSEEKGYIIIVKEISPQKQLEKESELLSGELQTSLLLMNQPIKPIVSDIKKCSFDTPVREAASIMTRKKRNVLFIGRENDIIGVINNNDLKNRVLATGLDPGKPVIEIMTSPVETISENALMYEALLKLKNKSISHLAVLNSHNKITGVIGYEDLIDIQQNTVSYLIREIETAEDVKGIAGIYKRLPVLVNALIESGDKTGNINRIITSVADAIHKRIIYFAIEDLGVPPCKFAFMVMGSEGRGEQTLATDQDNAIVYEDTSEERADETFKYFLTLGETINKDLNTVGYHFCKGNVMAMNPKWTRPLETWKNYFSNWINNSDPHDIMEAGIFFDFRCIYGECSLIDILRNHVNKVSENKSVFFYHMAQSVLKFKPPLNVFGKIVSEEHSGDELNVDIKKILFPVTSFIRLYSIREHLTETNSLERLTELFHRETIDKTSYDELKQAYNFLMYLRLRFQVNSITQNEVPGNIVNLNKLSRIEVSTLKKFFSEINELQTKIGFDFKSVE